MPALTVLLCSYNRAHYLEGALRSLRDQTLPADRYELLVVDDGSTDATRDVVSRHLAALPLRYFRQDNGGLAAARNLGLAHARGEIVFFFDDDDVASPTLLEQHLRSHLRHPEPTVAVLNHTSWSPELAVTPLMHFITEVGCQLFGYPRIGDRASLDYTYFWGGRTSCKRSLLAEHGVFDPVFRFGCEDIELGYRLSKHGLTVVYNPRAVSYMARPVRLAEFLARLRKQGRSQYVFSRLHDAPEVAAWCEVEGFRERWPGARPWYDRLVATAARLEELTETRAELGLEIDPRTERLFRQALWAVFGLTKAKGIHEAAVEAGDVPPIEEAPGAA